MTTKAQRTAEQIHLHMLALIEAAPGALALALCHTEVVSVITTRLASIGAEQPDLAEPALVLLADDPRRAAWQPARDGLAKLGSKKRGDIAHQAGEGQE